MGPKECAIQQEGISNYFATFNSMQVGNVLSYISFSNDNLEQIVNFNDDQNAFNNSVEKIRNFNCDPSQHYLKRLSKMFSIQSDEPLINAIQYALATFYDDE